MDEPSCGKRCLLGVVLYCDVCVCVFGSNCCVNFSHCHKHSFLHTHTHTQLTIHS
jgi:hypothetical protein